MQEISFDQIADEFRAIAMKQADDSACLAFESKLSGILDEHPDHYIVLFYLGSYYLVMQRFGIALAILHHAQQCAPGNSNEVLNNLANAYRSIYQYDKAEKYYQQALEIDDTDTDIYTNMGTMHINEGTPAEGERLLRKAIELDMLNTKARWNLSMALLEQEKFEEGFWLYSNGLATKDRTVKEYGNAAWWDGDDHPDKTIVIYGEQGLGDEIMFASTIKEMVPRFKKVIIDCHPRLEGLFKRSFPECTVYPTRKKVDPKDYAWWADKEQPEIKVSIGDIPKHLRKTASDFPKEAYLVADRERVEEYKQWLQLTGPAPYLCLSWFGGTHTTRKDLRALTLDMMQPIMECIGGTIISGQYTTHNKDCKAFRERTGIRLFAFPEVFEARRWERFYVVDDDGHELAVTREKDEAKRFAHSCGATVDHRPGPAYDYDETAAFVMAIAELGGAVVSVNNTMVHLCGALGVPCFTLTPSKPAWRYGLKRRDMVWYGPWVKQYRKRGSKWASAISTLIEDLGRFLKKREAA